MKEDSPLEKHWSWYIEARAPIQYKDDILPV